MKSIKTLMYTYLLLTLFATSATYAQGVLDSKALNVGIGVSGWGIPIYAGIDFPVHEDITIGGNLSFQTSSENHSGWTEKNTIIGISGRGDYHFNNILDLPEEWDLYGGLSLGYWIWNVKVKDDDGFFSDSYSAAGHGGFGIYGQVGARYFFKDNLAVNLELGGGTIISGGRLGITYLLR